MHPHEANRLQPVHPGGATSPHILLCRVQCGGILQHYYNYKCIVVLLLLSGVRLAMITIIFSSSFFSSPHFSPTAFSFTSLLLLSAALVPHSPPTLSKSLLTQSSHRIIGLPRLPFPSTFWTSALWYK